MRHASSEVRGRVSVTLLIGLGLVVAVLGWLVLDLARSAPRGEALQDALSPIVKGKDSDAALVAGVILENYRETRANAARWSGLYWGFTFAAAVLSALAALILKFEFFLKDHEALRKDVAVVFSVTAALLITISTSGDFQRKWQANRMAAAELERIGYVFLQGGTVPPRAHLEAVATSLMRRHESILGVGEGRGSSQAASGPSAGASSTLAR